MEVAITGGTGFLGQLLANQLLARGYLEGPTGHPEEIGQITLVDLTTKISAAADERINVARADISLPGELDQFVGRSTSVFHLAAILSGEAESNPDLAFRVNIDGTRNVLETCRKRHAQRAIFTSSLAVFGGRSRSLTAGDDTKIVPQSTYGTTKAIGELLVNEYARKGLVDGRCGRLPIVIIRPEPTNGAASDFASAVFRDPLRGKKYILPVELSTCLPVTGYRTCIQNLILLHERESADFGEDRSMNLPAISCSVKQMVDALKRVAGHDSLGQIEIEPNLSVQRIVSSWPSKLDSTRSAAIGCTADVRLDCVVEDYIHDFCDKSR